MTRAILIGTVVLILIGCEGAYYNMPGAGPAGPIRVQTVAAPDPEMQELMALMGRMAPPPGGLSVTAVSNLRQHSFQTVGGDHDPCIDPSGRVMAFSSTAHSRWPDIFVKRVDGKTVTQLTTDPASDIQPALSPDGRWIAFASNRSGNYEVYLMTADGKTIRQVTRGGGDNVHPSWSPDGDRLIYTCNSVRSGRWEMWIVSITRRGTRQFVGYGLFPVWSPTEDRIAYQRPRARGGRLFGIWTIELIDGEPSLPTLVADSSDKAFVSPAFNTDGRQMAFAALPPEGAGRIDIFTVDVDGENLQQLTKGPGRKYGPTWATDTIFFSCDRDGQENIWSIRVDPATPTRTAERTVDAAAGYRAAIGGGR